MEVLQNPQAKNFKVFKSILERKTISIVFGEEMLMLKKLKKIKLKNQLYWVCTLSQMLSSIFKLYGVYTCGKVWGQSITS